MNSPNNNNIFFFKKIYNSSISIGLLFFCLINFVAFGQEINPNGYNVFYYENGRVASEGDFKNNVPHGIWKSYYLDGTLKSVGKKTNGLSDSSWVFFDTEGRRAKRFEYAADKKNGCAVFFDTTGNVVKEIFYVNDVAQGEELSYYSSGEIKKRVTVVDGKEEGLLVEYDKNGAVITEEIYDNGYLKDRTEYNRLNDDGEKTGVWRDFYPNGDLKSETAYKNGEKNGLTKTFDKKGRLIDMQRMKGDTVAYFGEDIVMIKLYKEYYADGKVRLAGGDNNGKKTGIFREYDREGNIINGYIYEQDTMIAEGLILADGNLSR